MEAKLFAMKLQTGYLRAWQNSGRSCAACVIYLQTPLLSDAIFRPRPGPAA
jgi:hypothetical protein